MMDTKNKGTRQINLDHLYDLASGDNDFIREMIEYYLSQVPVIGENLRKYQAQKNWFELGEVAHKAKSSFKFMGIQLLTDDAKELEDICRELPDENRIKYLLLNIEMLMISSASELREELSKL
jgi:HPt (histidine-containing phosphotransfer) domain-containing protein